MPAGPQQVTSFLTALNEVNVRQGVFKMFSEGTFALDMVEKGKFGAMKQAGILAERDGKWIRVQAHTDGNPNVGVGVSERHGYPTPGHQQVNALYYRNRKLVATASHTTEVLAQSETTKQAAINAAALEMRSLIKNCRKRENWIFLNDGGGMFTDVAASGNNWDNTAKTLVVSDVSRFKVGMEVVPRNKTSGALGTGWTTGAKNGVTESKPAKVTAISTANNTITLKYYDDVAIDIATQTIFNGMGVYPWDQQGKVPWGLGIACSATNPSVHGFDPASMGVDATGKSNGFGGVDRAATDWFDAYVLSAGNQQISIVEHIEPIEDELITREPDLDITENSIVAISRANKWRAVIHELEAAKRTVTRTKVVEGRYAVVQSGMITFGWDPDMTANTMYFFDPKMIFRLIHDDWHFETKGGSQYSQLSDVWGRPTGEWQVNMLKMGQNVFMSVRPFAALTNIG